MRTSQASRRGYCLSGGAALAQTTLNTIDGSAAGELFGAAAAGPGDVDGDWVADTAIAVPKGSSGGLTPGVVRMLSGVDGSLIRETRGAFDLVQLRARSLTRRRPVRRRRPGRSPWRPAGSGRSP